METTATTYPIEQIRADFPVLHQEINGKPLIYLDNGASAQKPQAVIDVVAHYYKKEHSNVHRGVHTLSQRATAKYEEARIKLQKFLNAEKDHEVIFTKGTTDAINLVANAWGRTNLNQGDEVLISSVEHHSNIVPWQMICEERGATLKVAPITLAGELIQDEFERLLSSKTKMVAITHVSNTLGSVFPVEEIIKKAHQVGALVLIDGAQSTPHMQVDVQQLDVDFYCASAHKIYGPTGIGFLYGKESILDAMPPYQGGGDMIKTVSFEKTVYNDLPHKFEAGTPNIAGVIGFGAAIDYLNTIGMDSIWAHEHDLLNYATAQIKNIEGIRLIGEAKEKAGVLSFLVGSSHPYDIGILLDKMGIAVRTGHHCTMPLMDWYGIPGTARASFGIYNTKVEIDAFIAGIERAQRMLS